MNDNIVIVYYIILEYFCVMYNGAFKSNLHNLRAEPSKIDMK